MIFSLERNGRATICDFCVGLLLYSLRICEGGKRYGSAGWTCEREIGRDSRPQKRCGEWNGGAGRRGRVGLGWVVEFAPRARRDVVGAFRAGGRRDEGDEREESARARADPTRGMKGIQRGGK